MKAASAARSITALLECDEPQVGREHAAERRVLLRLGPQADLVAGQAGGHRHGEDLLAVAVERRELQHLEPGRAIHLLQREKRHTAGRGRDGGIWLGYE
jgi:hypothetical protein